MADAQGELSPRVPGYLATVPVLEEHLVRIEADPVATIVVDLVELTFIGSLGVHAFMAARERALANGRRLLLLGATTNVRRVFELTGTAFLLEDALGADLDPSPLGG